MSTHLAKEGVFMSDLILAEERRSPDESYYGKPVQRGAEGGIVDPGATHVLQEGKDRELTIPSDEWPEESTVQTEEQNLSFSDASSFVFVDPHFVLDLRRTYSCLTPKLSLQRLLTSASDPCRCLLALLNRSRSKPVFL